MYLNGISFYEVTSRDAVTNPPLRTEVTDDWTGVTEQVSEPARTQLVWYAEVEDDATTIWANFHGADPNTNTVEINVRRSVFYPTEHHVDFITVRGFELAQAASPWAPPTADQPGLIGPNWAKGWIIEDNRIHDAKCAAISIGKEASTGHNAATVRRDKPGYQYQLESVFAARQIGWDREHVGSHIIRGNIIYDCGQAGIVGHLGCAFSTIEDNHIYNIALKREFYGYEIAGIKLHAAIDVTIRHNRIHDCSLGTWLDWQAQGTRVSRNLFYDNRRDLFVEVSHGPYLVEHNVFASPASLELFSQGGAFVNNLVCGTVSLEPVLDRPTPFHVPHSTQVAGYAAIYGGDDRHVGNIYLGGNGAPAYGPTATPGTDSRPWHRRIQRSSAQPSRSSSPWWPTSPGATTNGSSTSSSRSTSTTTSTAKEPAPTTPSRTPSSSPAATPTPPSSTRATRSTSRFSCRRRSTTSASPSPPGRTSNRSASSTPSSRNRTAPPPCHSSTSPGSSRRCRVCTQPDPWPPSRPGASRTRVW